MCDSIMSKIAMYAPELENIAEKMLPSEPSVSQLLSQWCLVTSNMTDHRSP